MDVSSELKKLIDEFTNPNNGYIDQETIDIFNILPSRPQNPDYYSIIHRPMSFQKIYRQSKHYKIEKIQDFVSDLCQIVHNCKTFNPPESIFYKKAENLETCIKEKIIPKVESIFDVKDLKYIDMSTVSEPSPPSPEPKSAEVSQDVESKENNEINNKEESSQPKKVVVSQDHVNMENAILDPSQLDGTDDGNGIFTAVDGRQFLTSIDVAKNFTKVPVGDINRYPSFIRDRTMVYERKVFDDINEHVARKKGRPTLKSDLEMRFINFLNDEKLLTFPLLDNKAEFSFDGKVNTYEQVKFNIKRGFITDVDELYRALEQVTSYQVENCLRKDREEVTSFCTRVSQKALIYFKDVPNDMESNDKFIVDRFIMDEVVYEIGSFVLLRNPVDPTRPIPAQIFQIWREHDDSLWMSCSWYLRPEQTVHRADRVFYRNEVVKSNQSRIHRAEDIIGLCTVIHFTRYVRAEPLDSVGPVFICEYRYNDTSYRFNKIRTWKGAVPECVKELAEVDVPLAQLRFMKKFESPLKHLVDPSLPLNTDHPQKIFPTLQTEDDREQPSLGNVYRDKILDKDELGEYSTSRVYTQRHLVLPQHFDLIPSNIRFEPVNQSFIDSTNALASFVYKVYDSGINVSNLLKTEGSNRIGPNSFSRALPQVSVSDNGSKVQRLATLSSLSPGPTVFKSKSKQTHSTSLKNASGLKTQKDESLKFMTKNAENMKPSITKSILTQADKAKKKFNTTPINSKQTGKGDISGTKSHYLDGLLELNKHLKGGNTMVNEDRSILNPNKMYLLNEEHSYVLNTPLLNNIEGFVRTDNNVHFQIIKNVESYNEERADKNNELILYNNKNLKNEEEKLLQEFKKEALLEKEAEEEEAKNEAVNSDEEIDNLYLTKNERKRRGSEGSMDSFVDSELSETEIIERKAYKKLQKRKLVKEEDIINKYYTYVDGMNKGDLIWFTGLSQNISKRVIDIKDPLKTVGPSLEYLKFKMNKK